MKNILLIDDEEDFCFFVKANLEGTSEFAILTATNGSDGLRLAREQLPDLILLDLYMPDMFGDEVMEELIQSPETASIPVIFLTALVNNSETGPENLKEIGGRYFIAKPVATNALVRNIRKMLTVPASTN